MSTSFTCDEALVVRLPLPLAQLYRRAHNAKSALERHQAAFYLWEATLKLLASIAVVEYAELGCGDPEIQRRLRNLARPSLGHWWEFLRSLLPILAEAHQDPFFRTLRELVLGRTRDDLPRTAGLDVALCQALEQPSGARSTVRVLELFDRLVRYRNREFGHGAAGQQPREYYDRLGAALLAGISELLRRIDLSANRLLVYVSDVRRQPAGGWVIENYLLIGETPRRTESLDFEDSDASALPRPDRVYIRAARRQEGSRDTTLSGLRSLHPLVLYEHDSEDFYFLNSKRGQRQTEYLCYSSGAVVRKRGLETDQRQLLAGILGDAVDAEAVEQWAQHSLAEEAPSRAEESGQPRRAIGEFELLSRIGHGGMGVVYRAWQPSLSREVALKSLFSAGDARVEARFAREIRALGRVEHSHLVKIFTSGSDGDQWFYAMELIDGTDLGRICQELTASSASDVGAEEWLRAVSNACEGARRQEVPLSPTGVDGTQVHSGTPATLHDGFVTEESASPPARVHRVLIDNAVEIIRQVARAAHALHEAGIVHRDIKPGNIMLTADGSHAVLMDLGLAQMADEEGGQLTRTRQFVGTLRYASPEQVLAAGALDRRADVYGLGATLWELLTLQPIFDARSDTPTPELMKRIQSKDAERPSRVNPKVPLDLDAIVLKCLEKDPEQRYLTAVDLAEDLRRWQRNEPVSAQPPTFRYVLGKFMRRYRKRLAAAATAALLLVSALAGTSIYLFTLNRDLNEAYSELSRASSETAQLNTDLSDANETLNQTLRRQYRAYGVQLLDHGMPFDAMPWFVEALGLPGVTPEEKKIQLVRIRAVLEQSPKPLRIWFHDGSVNSVEFSADGRLLITASDDHTAKILEASTGKELAELRHDADVNGARFSPDRRFALTFSNDSTARLWSVPLGEPLATFRHTDAVRAGAFSRDGRRLITASADRTAKVWDVRTRELVRTLEHPQEVYNAVFSPVDSNVVATACLDSYGRVWNVETGEMVRSPRHGDGLFDIAFDPLGERVVSGGLDPEVRVWSATTGEELVRLGHPLRVNNVAFHPDGERVLTTSADGVARLWDTTSGRLLHRFQHKTFVRGARFTHDGSRVVTTSADRTARVWRTDTGEPDVGSMKHGGVVWTASFSPDAERLATASGDGSVRLWFIGERAQVVLAHAAPVYHAEFSPDGTRIASAALDRKARVWNVESGELLAECEMPTPNVLQASFHPSGQRLLAFDHSGVARLFDPDTGERIGQDMKHRVRIYHARFSPDGQYILTVALDHTARLWDAASGEPRSSAPLTDSEDHCHYHGSFNHDLTRVVTGGKKGARVFSFDGTPLTPFLSEGAGKRVNFTAFAPDNSVLTAGDGGVWHWDAAGETVLHHMEIDDEVNNAFLSEDGRLLATASKDGGARVWEVATGNLWAPEVVPGGGPMRLVELSRDGGYLLTSNEAGTARVWETSTGAPITPPFRHDISRQRPEGGLKFLSAACAAFDARDERVLTASGDGTVKVWSLAPIDESSVDLQMLGQALSAQRIEESRATPLEHDELRRLWEEISARYPEDFRLIRAP